MEVNTLLGSAGEGSYPLVERARSEVSGGFRLVANGDSVKLGGVQWGYMGVAAA